MAVLGSEDEGGDGGRILTQRVGKARKDLYLRNSGEEALGGLGMIAEYRNQTD